MIHFRVVKSHVNQIRNTIVTQFIGLCTWHKKDVDWFLKHNVINVVSVTFLNNKNSVIHDKTVSHAHTIQVNEEIVINFQSSVIVSRKNGNNLIRIGITSCLSKLQHRSRFLLERLIISKVHLFQINRNIAAVSWILLACKHTKTLLQNYHINTFEL